MSQHLFAIIEHSEIGVPSNMHPTDPGGLEPPQLDEYLHSPLQPKWLPCPKERHLGGVQVVEFGVSGV